MYTKGLLENLPLVAFRRLLDFLPVRDIMNIRSLSHRLKKKVTLVKPNIFDTLNIKIDETNCFTICKFLFFIMTGPYAPKKLKLHFDKKLNKVMEEILVDYKDNIAELDVSLDGNEEILLKLDFNHLESLELHCYWWRNTNKRYHYKCREKSASLSNVLGKHASKVKKLKVFSSPEFLTSSAPALPKLEVLSLEGVWNKVSTSLFYACKQTIHTLELIGSNVYETSDHLDLGNSAAYFIKNLMHLTLHDSKSLNFYIHNSSNLVSLVLEHVDHIMFNNSELPELPKLRELVISNAQHLPLLQKSRDSLERFVYWNQLPPAKDDNHIPQSNTDVAKYEAGVLPNLTDLYLIEVDPHNQFCTRIIIANHKSLEFLYYFSDSYKSAYKLKPDMNKKCMKMMRVVMRTKNMWRNDWDKLERLCPNALVTNQNDMGYVNARRRRKGFSIYAQRHIEEFVDDYRYL